MLNFLKIHKKDKLEEAEAKKEKKSLFSSLVHGLKHTHHALVDGISGVFQNRPAIDKDLFDKLETELLTADIGVKVTNKIITELKTLQKKQNLTSEDVIQIIRQQLENILIPCSQKLIIPPDIKPFVILLVGVNGSGKTTTIGKLTKALQNVGRKVMLAAGDTFRAAAIDQLKIWGERNAVPVIAQHPGADSAAVLFDAMQSAKARNIDVLIADTAGRLHTQDNLMSELQKIKRTLQKIDPTAPHELLLVLDASIGQNALNQAKQFNEAVGITGLCITKLDGTAKGGIIFAIAEELKLPIRFIGVGEQIDDLKDFSAHDFVAALFAKPIQ